MSQHEAEDLRTALGVGAERRAAQGRGCPSPVQASRGGGAQLSGSTRILRHDPCYSPGPHVSATALGHTSVLQIWATRPCYSPGPHVRATALGLKSVLQPWASRPCYSPGSHVCATALGHTSVLLPWVTRPCYTPWPTRPCYSVNMGECGCVVTSEDE